MFSLLSESIKIAISSIISNKTRSLLTGLSIIIGISTVTLMGTLISGLDRGFDRSMDFLGKDVLSISRWEWFGDLEWWEVRNRPRIKIDYIDKIKERSKYAEAVAPVLQRGASLSRGDLGARSQIFGTTPDYLKTTKYGVAEGRFFTKGEDRSGARVALLGHDVAENLFPNQDPIGKYFKIDGIRFKALGVMEKQGKFLGLFSFS